MLLTILFILLVLLYIFQMILYIDIRRRYFNIKEVLDNKDIIDEVNDDCERLFDTVL